MGAEVRFVQEYVKCQLDCVALLNSCLDFNSVTPIILTGIDMGTYLEIEVMLSWFRTMH